MGAERDGCFVREYSALAGLQAAHTLRYMARAVPQGVLLELCCEQAGGVRRSAALCPGGSLPYLKGLLQYLCENSVGPAQWLAVLEDLGVDCRPETPPSAAPREEFCGFCQI